MKVKVKGELLWTGEGYRELRLNGALVGYIDEHTPQEWDAVCSYQFQGIHSTANEARVAVTTKFRAETGIRKKAKWTRARYTRDTLILAGGYDA